MGYSMSCKCWFCFISQLVQPAEDRMNGQFKPKHLEKITGLEAEGSKGKLTARKAEYEVISRKRKKSLGASHAEEGAEEMDQLRVMLPRKEKNGSLWCLGRSISPSCLVFTLTKECRQEAHCS